MKRNSLLLYLLLVFCLCCPNGLLYAVQNSSRFSLASITINDGLPYNFVDDIIKSSDGYLWVATYGGLFDERNLAVMMEMSLWFLVPAQRIKKDCCEVILWRNWRRMLFIVFGWQEKQA